MKPRKSKRSYFFSEYYGIYSRNNDDRPNHPEKSYKVYYTNTKKKPANIVLGLYRNPKDIAMEGFNHILQYVFAYGLKETSLVNELKEDFIR